MKAIVLERPGVFAERDLPDPTPGPDEVVVAVAACGICGSDLQLVAGSLPGATYPVVPGHELAGEVVAVGAGVEGSVSVGDRVAVDPSLPCGRCAPCRRGRVNLCRHLGVIGATVDGGFAEYVKVPVGNAYPLPEEIGDPAAALLEPLACVLHGFERLAPAPGDAILILGAGAIGMMLLELATHSCAARIAVVEPNPGRRQSAERRGAEAHTTVDEAVQVQPDRFDAVIDATGVPAALEEAFGAVAPGGRMMVFGVAPADRTIRISPYRVYRDEISVLGSMSVGHSFSPAIALLTSGSLSLEHLVSHTAKLSEFEQALALLRSGTALKCQVTPS